MVVRAPRKPRKRSLCKISPVVPSTTSTNPSVLARANLVSSGENWRESTGAGRCVAKLLAPVRAVEHVTKPNLGAGGAVPGGGAGAAPPQATRSPSWLQLADATLCAAVPSISATNAELVLTTAAPFAPTRAKHINEPSGTEPLGGRPRTRRTGGCPLFFCGQSKSLARVYAQGERLLARPPRSAC